MSGRPNRMFKTDYIKDWETNRKAEIETLTEEGTIPFQADWRKHESAGTLAAQIGYEKGFSVAANHRFLMGQCSAAITSILPAKQIIETMVTDAVRVMRGHVTLIKTLPPSAPPPEIEEPRTKKPPIPQKEYTLAEVAQHNAPDDLWIVVNGMVVDFSKFDHPGAKETLMHFAGKDASTEFNMMHGEQMIYNNIPEAIIGSLKASSKL